MPMPSHRKLTPPLALEPDPWMSVLAASRALGKPRQTIYNWCIGGTLESQVVAGRVVVSRASVDRVRAELAAAPQHQSAA
jgi:hypothetical protein